MKPFNCMVCHKRIGLLRRHYVLLDYRVTCAEHVPGLFRHGVVVEGPLTRREARRLVTAHAQVRAAFGLVES